MKKIKTDSTEYVIVQTILIAVMGMIIWPLLDLFICGVIMHTPFVYSVSDHILEPVVYAGILGVVLWVIEKKKK